MKLYAAKSVREVDRIAIEEMGIPSLALMENAARAIASALEEEFPSSVLRRPVMVCGKGNNGGDGMAVARLLKEAGREPSVALVVPVEALSGDARAQADRLGSVGVPLRTFDSEREVTLLRDALRSSTLVVDALLGTGIGAPARGAYAAAIAAINGSGLPVAAVDIPSGLSGDALVPIGPAVRAGLTLTLALAKPILFTPEGAAFCGRVRLLDIGIPAAAVERVKPCGEALDEAWARPFFRPRPAEAHKGFVGRVLLVAGSLGKSGAAVLAARGALRAGAGLVTVATPASAQGAVAAALPEAMTLPLPETAAGTLSMDALMPLLDFCGQAEAVGLGPGVGQAAETAALCRELFLRLPVPAVVDADALNAFAGHEHALRDHEAARLLTPHPGEMSRLSGLAAREVVASRYDLVPSKADEWGAVVLLKGYRTLVAAPGETWRMNLPGGPHMAGPGFGDVLTGVAAALLARGMAPAEAASLAAWWHGAAADLAFERLGGYGLLAGEAADALPAVEGRLRRP
jgi:NAD(P)H-hydrate epimerase